MSKPQSRRAVLKVENLEDRCLAAVDAFIWFESPSLMHAQVQTKVNAPATFEITGFTFGVENPTTIGSATGGAGAGKIKFNEFTIKKTSDSASPALVTDTSTSADQTVVIDMRKAGSDPKSAGAPAAFGIQDFSFGIENPTTIGSATGGAGAGKIKFNEFTITKTSDAASPLFF